MMNRWEKFAVVYIGASVEDSPEHRSAQSDSRQSSEAREHSEKCRVTVVYVLE